MPAAMQYEPRNADLRQAATKERDERRKRLDMAWNYYQGQHKTQYPVTAGKPNDNVRVNLVKACIDRTVAFLFPEMPVLQIDALRETDVERGLRAWWQSAGGARLMMRLARTGAIEGHVYARIAPTTDGAGLRVIALRAANVVTFWQADDPETVLWHELYYNAAGREYRMDAVQMDAGWSIQTWERQTQGGRWEELGDPVMWPYSVGPIVAWPHMPGREYYGVSEAEAITLNDQVNKVASDVNRILRFHASPRTVGTGFKTDGLLETGVDQFYSVENAEAKIYNLEMKSDLESSLKHLETLTNAYLSEQRVVMLRGNVADFQRVTNLGMRALFIDMIAKNEELRLNYEPGLTAITTARMQMMGMPGADIAWQWADPLPVDPAESVGVLERERQMGLVSRETAARERGRDWEIEIQRMMDENDQAMRPVQGT